MMKILKSDIFLFINGFVATTLVFWNIENLLIKILLLIILGITIVSFGITIQKEALDEQSKKMKYITKYIPFPNRINIEGTNVMFLINGEWTKPCSFDSYIGPDIQSAAGGVLCLCNDEQNIIELANQSLNEGLEFDRNDFELKWTNLEGKSSFILSEVINDDDENAPILKAYIKTK